MTIALHKSRLSIGFVPLLAALLAALLIGGVGGYTAKLLTTTSTTPAGPKQVVNACAAGAHPIVWYTAGTWACVNDAQ